MELKDRVALVTGGGTGLGRVIATQMAREGAHLAVGYSRSEREAAETVEDLEGMGARAIAVKADVTDSAQVRAMMDRVVSEFGRIDVLVNNAAVTVFVPFEDVEGMKEEDWDRLMAINAKGPFLCSQAAIPIMKGQGQGRIVNIGTVSGLRPMGSSIAYSVSKAALTHFTRCLANAVSPEITVNLVAPGSMLTRWFPNLTEEQKKRTIDGAPLKRYSGLEDVAAAVLMVAKNDSMTGAVFQVDAGVTLVR
jgi:3-oxoacyl-[acyl-carrier protein] reductase